MDETTFSLNYPIRSCWMRRGQQKKITAFSGKREYLHVIGAYNWRSDAVTYLTVERKNSDSFIEFLEKLLVTTYPNQPVILVMDIETKDHRLKKRTNVRTYVHPATPTICYAEQAKTSRPQCATNAAGRGTLRCWVTKSSRDRAVRSLAVGCPVRCEGQRRHCPYKYLCVFVEVFGRTAMRPYKKLCDLCVLAVNLLTQHPALFLLKTTDLGLWTTVAVVTEGNPVKGRRNPLVSTTNEVPSTKWRGFRGGFRVLAVNL